MKSLPYDLPEGTQAQLEFLAKVTDIPKESIRNAGEKELEAIAAMMVYRHLDGHARIEAMGMIHDLDNKRLASILVTKTLDVTFLNPQWGIWSLTNAELQADIKFHTAVNWVASALGLSLSAPDAKNLLKESWKFRKVKPKGWVTVVVWGTVAFNAYELNKAQAELNHRQKLLTTEYH